MQVARESSDMTNQQSEIRSSLRQFFTPTQPITLPDLLTGRMDLLSRVCEDLLLPSQHVLLYGDRGVGKTSIARVLALLAEGMEEAKSLAITVSCDTNDTFSTIWRKVLQEVRISRRKPSIGLTRANEVEVVSRYSPSGDLDSPNDIRILVEDSIEAGGLPLTVIIDEYDRVVDDDARRLMTDTIKMFSDNSTGCTLVLVGVSQSVEELIDAHQSIARNLDFVHVEPMGTEELAKIVRNGFGKAGLDFEAGLDFRIGQLSQGYPHYTHLLGLLAGLSAVSRDSDVVTFQDLRKATNEALQRAAESIRLEYDSATDSTQPNNLYKEVLLACALVSKDDRGRFTLSWVGAPLQKLLDRPIKPVGYQRHLSAFCLPERGPTLIKTGRPKNYRWRFANPQLIPFVILKGIEDGLVEDNTA